MGEKWTWIGEPENIHVVEASHPHMRICFMTSDGPTEERANLIAAAPDMAEALWQLLDDMGEDGLCVCPAAKEQARAAYLKAIGGQDA
jgi:hypothetical protein